MASLEEELCCSICCGIFTEPVLLSCSHSFCSKCLQEVWKLRNSKECPLCRRKSSRDHPPINLVLKNVCEILQRGKQKQTDGQERGLLLCGFHQQNIQLWCRQDSELVCLECVTSSTHRAHDFCKITDAVREKKIGLTAALQPLTEKLEDLEKIKRGCNSTATFIKKQANQSEAQIKQEFEKLHKFLREEEAARISELREEEAQKIQLLEESIEKIGEKLDSISQTIQSIRNQIQSNDVTFLLSFDKTKNVIQWTLQDPENIPVPLIDVAKHLNLLKYRVWEKMLDIVQYIPVCLDPLSAHPQLSLSEELTSVSYSHRGKSAPPNPERFDLYVFVLGAEGFDSGSHSWDVEIGPKQDCRIGVAQGGVQRKGHFSVCPAEGFYTIALRKREFRAGTLPETRLDVKKRPPRIRVSLEYEKGEVTFSDASDGTLIYTFKETFTEKLYPLFGPSKDSTPLRISQRVVRVTHEG
ncbi:nuclear factor 7, brain-like [Trichomycterus rosablanca]|uniref:nuclear factor 7, brain-like n=1 Tax=Trichomycterus rosablanca TaxID=2290929 RepID=UPI002F353A23